ncbi:uncharacterized protein [Littorina saxatilis]|uniref:uncharacterized protein n=1 Tax=Littorina saxatilis TaxID=31220 RepID=UPI0038B6379E
MALTKHALNLPLKEATAVGYVGCNFGNTASQLERNFSGQSHVLFSDCTFKDVDVPFRCSKPECSAHVAWARDLIRKPADKPKSKKYVELPGYKESALVQWLQSDTESTLETMVVRGANVEAKPHSQAKGSCGWFKGTTWEFAHCMSCGQQVGWIHSSADDAFFVLWMARVAYN